MKLIWTELEMAVSKDTGEKYSFPKSYYWEEIIVAWLKDKDIHLTKREIKEIAYNDFHKFFSIVIYDNKERGQTLYEHRLKAMRELKTDSGQRFEDNGGTWYWHYPEGTKPGGGDGVMIEGREFKVRVEK